MIQVQVYKETRKYKKILILGHAMYDDYGKDIVCSACSSIVTTTVNGILALKEGTLDYIIQLILKLIFVKVRRRIMKFLKLDIQLFAHHKGQGSTSNGRDSIGRRLGAKASDGEYVTAGSIIYRQRGTRIFPGTNTRRGNDDSIYSTIDGIVKFERLGRDKKKASVYPVAE